MLSRQVGSVLAAAVFAVFAVVLLYFREDNAVRCNKFQLDEPVAGLKSEGGNDSANPGIQALGATPKGQPVQRKRKGKKTDTDTAAPPEVLTDAATGLSLPRTKRFSKLDLTCLGVGVRAKSLAVAKVNVYTVGLYVDQKSAKGALKKFARTEPGKLWGDGSVFKVLGEPGGFTKYLHLVFSRSVSAQKVVDALTSVKGVDEEVLSRFSHITLGAIGQKIEKGETVSLGWEGKDKMVVMVRDKLAGTVTDKALPKAVFELYLGPDPVAPSAKAAFAEGITSLFSS